MMDWDEILKEVVAGSILLAIGGVSGWFCGLFKGKKASSRAIERKNEIYQPLIDDIEKYTLFNWSIKEKVKTPFLYEVVNNSYKYGLGEDVQSKCRYLYDVIHEYNSIDLMRVAHSIVSDIFEKGYTEIYGCIIDGIAYHCDRDGNEWEEEVLVEPVQTIRQSSYSREIQSLLLNEGIYSDEVCVDKEKSLYQPIYLQLKNIYQSALEVVINGKKHVNPKPIIELTMLPEEYMALRFDFFEIYNNDERIKKREKLREEIIYTSQAVAQTLKETIEQIIKIYEVEVL